MIPAVRVQNDVHDLKSRVGVQLRPEEDDDVKADIHDGRRPAPDILSDAQENADYAKDSSNYFDCIHDEELTE